MTETWPIQRGVLEGCEHGSEVVRTWWPNEVHPEGVPVG
jgi:hypothetical protein